MYASQADRFRPVATAKEKAQSGETFVVPKGEAHQPVADGETTLLLFEPSETVNTGDTPSELTARRRLATPEG